MILVHAGDSDVHEYAGGEGVGDVEADNALAGGGVVGPCRYGGV